MTLISASSEVALTSLHKDTHHQKYKYCSTKWQKLRTVKTPRIGLVMVNLINYYLLVKYYNVLENLAVWTKTEYIYVFYDHDLGM